MSNTLSRRKVMQYLGFSVAGLGLTPLGFAKGAKADDAKLEETLSNPSLQHPPGQDPALKQMVKHLRRANDVANKAVQSGHHPFGAVLVDADNETVVLEQGNVSSVAHAESTLAQRAAEKFSPEQLWGMTLYSTAEPCVMCAGTQYWANIGRLVYGMSERQLLDFTGNHEQNPTLDVPSRYVFSKGQKAIRVWGPIDQVVPEIAALHQAFWK